MRNIYVLNILRPYQNGPYRPELDIKSKSLTIHLKEFRVEEISLQNFATQSHYVSLALRN